MSWKPGVEEIEQRRERAEEMTGAERLGLHYSIPLIRPVNGFGGNAGMAQKHGFSILPGRSMKLVQFFVALPGQIPIIGAIPGNKN
jgi:hypothetical protein